MPYDIETDTDVIRLIDTDALNADHIYINDVDMTTIEDNIKKISEISDRLASLESKIDALTKYVQQLHNNIEI